MPTIGLLYPGHSAEDDYPALEARLGSDLRLPLVHTSVGEDAHRVDALLDLGGAERLAEGARELVATHSPDAVMWACTSGSFVFGWDGAHEQVAQLQEVTGLPTSSTSLAFVAACRALGLSRVSVAASYPQDVAEHFVDFLRAGHHGSQTSLNEDFLRRLSPSLAGISVGEGNPFGHPSKAVLQMLEASETPYLRTDQDGTVVLSGDGKFLRRVH